MKKSFYLVLGLILVILVYFLGFNQQKSNIPAPVSNTSQKKEKVKDATVRNNIFESKEIKVEFNPQFLTSNNSGTDTVLIDVLIINPLGEEKPFEHDGSFSFYGESGKEYYWNNLEYPNEPFKLSVLKNLHIQLQSLNRPLPPGIYRFNLRFDVNKNEKIFQVKFDLGQKKYTIPLKYSSGKN